MGNFFKISWKYNAFPCKLELNRIKERLMKNLKVIFNIGEKIERKFKKRGISTIHHLTDHLQFGTSAKSVLQQISNRNYRHLTRNRYVYDIDVGFFFDLKDFLFLDIETLGLYDSPIIMIGLGFFNTAHQFEIQILFARELEEEIALCHHFQEQILPKFKCFVTYNGKSFDIPYIANRLLYYFDENPMIKDSDTPYEQTNTLYHHIDLYHNVRRVFKEQYQNYTLTNIERCLLNSQRENELPSHLVGMCYRKYKKNPRRYIGLIKKCIDHNHDDIYSLPLILQRIINNF
jgi:hypothetical protein